MLKGYTNRNCFCFSETDICLFNCPPDSRMQLTGVFSHSQVRWPTQAVGPLHTATAAKPDARTTVDTIAVLWYRCHIDTIFLMMSFDVSAVSFRWVSQRLLNALPATITPSWTRISQLEKVRVPRRCVQPKVMPEWQAPWALPDQTAQWAALWLLIRRTPGP